MESSSSNSEEMELQEMQLEGRELHQKYFAWFKKLKTHLEFLHNTSNISVWLNMRPYEIAFRIFFHKEYETFRVKKDTNLNQLQWQLERKIIHLSNPKSCLKVLRTPFKEFFDSKKVNASDFENKSWQNTFKDIRDGNLKLTNQQQSLVTEGAILEACLVTKGATLEACLVNESRALDDNLVVKETTDDSVTSSEQLDKSISSQQPHATFPQLDSGLVVPKEKEFQEIKEIEIRLQESKMHKQESLVSKGTSLEDCLVTEDAELEACFVNKDIEVDDNLVAKESIDDFVTSSEKLDESSRSQNENSSSHNEIKSSENEISNSDGNDADADIGHSYDSATMSEIRENMIICAFFSSLINNLKCDVDKCSKVNNEAQQANALLTNELERYKEKEKHFAKDKTIESEYCKKIKFLNDEISNLKSLACEKDKTFAKENEKYDEYVQPLLKRKTELEKKNQEFLKQINDLDNRLRITRQNDQTLRMLLPKEDNVNTGKQGLGFGNQNNDVNPSLLNKAKS
ncbi:hypothetical protein Tco_0040920 [Tanacetum coccineum]